MKNYGVFEHFSESVAVGATILCVSGETEFESAAYRAARGVLSRINSALDCFESCQIALLYGCYQSKRFGGRYIFFAPNGLAYCVSPLLDKERKMTAGVIAGPFMLYEPDEFLSDLEERVPLDADTRAAIEAELSAIPYLSPKRAHALSEHLYHTVAGYNAGAGTETGAAAVQTDIIASAYPIDKEDEMLTAVRNGDIQSAYSLLDGLLSHILYQSGGNIEVLRSRIVELTVLLSRAALSGGADKDAVLSLSYDYLREIDGFKTADDIILWMPEVVDRFAKQVFEFPGVKHTDIIYKATGYIRRNYAKKLTLREIADRLYISPQYLSRIFKNETGQTPGSYITHVRVEESKKLLVNTDTSIVDIPEMVGFEGQSYFTKVFKKFTGVTPGHYRRESTRG